MIRNYKCSFCARQIARTTGNIYVKTDGTIQRFCDQKCKKSTLMKRNPRKLKWTDRYERKY